MRNTVAAKPVTARTNPATANHAAAYRVAGLVLGLSMLAAPAAAGAAECPGNPDALGTSRTIVVDPAEHPRIGAMQYHETLPLEDHEIVITFDDGPLPPRTTAVLDTLDRECVKATFFLVGKMAHAYPDTVKRMRDAGHTIGTHSNSHPFTFHRMSVEKAQIEVNQGIANVTAALGDDTGPAPFFRIPGLLRGDAVERFAASQNLQIWSTDFLADDWTKIGPQQVYSRAIQRIEAAHKGILLLHDIQAKTVEALPWILRDLKKRGFKIVQVVPATAEHPKTVTDPGQWMLHSRHLSRTPTFMDTEPELPVPNPASFGFDVSSSSISFTQRISMAREPGWRPLPAPEPGPLTPMSMWPSGFEGSRQPPKLSDQFHMPAAPSGMIDVVGEARGIVGPTDIQHLLESLPDESPLPAAADDASGQMAALRSRGPAPNTAMPRGAFP
jgi:peptidoglycan/xylan/chitin deacetylase (PgdA/CDA1 family)